MGNENEDDQDHAVQQGGLEEDSEQEAMIF